MERYNVVDAVRGITIISMILYHGIWDIVYLFNYSLPWFESYAGYIWQQSICRTFIILSGFCFHFSRNSLRRGLTVLLGGAVINAVTAVIMPQERIVFGILTLIGSCMLITMLFDRLLSKLNGYIGLILSFALFLFTKNINYGYLGINGLNPIQLPKCLYRNILTAYIGFPSSDFRSLDYFSLFPWIFLFMCGYFLFIILRRSGRLELLRFKSIAFFEWIGRHSFVIYLLHQPCLALLLELCLLYNRTTAFTLGA